ncbi:MAG: ComF family protein [Clostridia bacterium]|nr:ComF family protein [Clostridia bacterium]NCC76575.1 ComF family protein [Clostridia bacterium]
MFDHARLAEILFPDTCLICRRSVSSRSGIPNLCRQCLGKLPWRTQDGVMAWPEDLTMEWPGHTESSVPSHLEFLLRQSEIIVACNYEPPIRDGLLALKFSDASEWHRLLAGLLAQAVRRRLQRYSAVIAVPLHDQRLAERGYNQAGLLAQALAAELELPDWSAWLHRTRQTDRQSAQISRQARLANLAGAFSWSGPSELRPARVLLVDDILTTGATLVAAARPLFQHGASVTGLVVASSHHSYGPKPGPGPLQVI